ncbi:hypothetical protein A2T98_03510 [Nodularia spumigena CENA596]|uniref:Low-complexity protein n=1 Tax=Nodularia spumigena CENA596 TaxID=1819295 RepID=A0A166KJA1_NODSP|nr:hypothetical protein A2T98_03510 [Nodularia spumigena CENA596]
MILTTYFLHTLPTFIVGIPEVAFITIEELLEQYAAGVIWADLNGAELNGASLIGANLSNANLTNRTYAQITE